MRTPRWQVGAIAFVAVAFLMAPTVGDVGGCGRQATALDPAAFERAKKTEDCRRCGECGLATQRCVRACDPKSAGDVVVPDTCYPLFHDGEVCLNALIAASCDDYATYVDDVSPATPSECDFCHDAASTASDGGTL